MPYFIKILLTLFFLAGSVSAQMSTQKFKRIKTDNYELIFPESIQAQALRIAALLESRYNENYLNLDADIKHRIPIVLNHLSLMSNGFVTLAPFYSMFYLLSPQMSTYALFYSDWIETLAIHEMRHKVQFQFLNRGYNRLLYVVFGDAGLAAGMGLSAPSWFFEGDAVYHETQLTRFGRGRISSFTSLTKAFLDEERYPSYANMALGSNLVQYPNIYETGYLLVAYMKKKYGPEIFAEILEFSSSWNVLLGPYAFAAGVLSKTNRSIHRIHRDMMTELQALWKAERAAGDFTEYTFVTKRNKNLYTHYDSPCGLSDGRIIALKYGRFQTGAIVEIRPGKPERVLVVTGNINGNISCNENAVVWSEDNPDPRWDDSSTKIKIYNLKSKKLIILKAGGRIIGPSISADGTFLAAMEFDRESNFSLVILRADSGKVERKVSVPGGYLWQTPRWGLSSSTVALVESSGEGKAIVLYHYREDKVERPMTPVYRQISDPYIVGEKVLYHSDYSGPDNIFAFDLENNKIYQVTKSYRGAIQPSVSPDLKTVYFTNITKDGRYISSIPFNPAELKEARETNRVPYAAFQEKTDKDLAINQPNNPSAASAGKNFKVDDYPDFVGAFNFHSRYIDPYELILNSNISLGVISSNVLQTHFMRLDYVYSIPWKMNAIQAQWVYRGWYPVISLGGYHLDSPFFSSQNGGYFEMSLPLKFYSGSIVQNLDVGAHFALSGFDAGIEGQAYMLPRNLYYLNYRFHSRGNSILWDTPYLSVGAQFGAAPDFLVFNNSHDLYSAQVYFEVPGFFYNNRITLRGGGGYREDTYDSYGLSAAPYPRGDSTADFSEMFIASVDYFLPLFYPDWDILHVLYLRQVGFNIFYEHVWYRPDYIDPMNYLGVDFLLSLNFFELNTEITGGVRMLYYPDRTYDNLVFEPLIYFSGNIYF